MTILSTLATIFGTLIGVANFPQAIKIFKRKSAKDISIISVSIFFTGSIIWTLYGIELMNFPVIITNSLAFVSLLFMLIGWFLYGGAGNGGGLLGGIGGGVPQPPALPS